MRENLFGILTAIALIGGFIAASLAASAHLGERCADWGHPQSIACKPHN